MVWRPLESLEVAMPEIERGFAGLVLCRTKSKPVHVSSAGKTMCGQRLTEHRFEYQIVTTSFMLQLFHHELLCRSCTASLRKRMSSKEAVKR